MILSRIVSRLVICLLLTVIIEAAFAFVFGIRNAYGQLIIFLSNLITNPILNCTLTAVCFYVSASYYYAFLVPLEIAAVLCEGLIYKKTLNAKMNPFLLSFVLNVCSYFLGTGILKITG